MKNISAKPMESKFKNIINESYVACMNGTATEEQELIWRLANAIHCTRTRWMTNDIEAARRILYENDYTAGTN